MPQYIDVSKDTRPSVTSRRAMNRAGILLHSTEGVNSLAWLQGGSADAGTPASADFLLPRNGDCLQLTRPGMYAFHAGAAMWHGLTNLHGLLNEILIGIEVESNGKDSPRYTDPQIITLAALVKRLVLEHFLSVTNIDRHGDIAVPPGRRSDPVGFPLAVWSKELLTRIELPHGLVFPDVLP